ncbi:MAG: phospholipase A [Pseudomonadales bacterium]|nr:phospholipase A [Pseudomonadales bacterium]
MHRFLIGMVLMLCLSAVAETETVLSDYQHCVLQQLKQMDDAAYIGDLKARCIQKSGNHEHAAHEEIETQAVGGIKLRIKRESEGIFNPYALTPHRPSYIMFSAMDHANQTPYAEFGDNPDPLENTEILYQLSIKAPVWPDVMGSNGDLYVGITIKSWWQLFNKEVSSPFRETNYEPEIFWQKSSDWAVGGWDMPGYRIGFVHESNGRNIPLSRSWNRVYAEFAIERGNWDLIFKPWYRIPEKDKRFDGDTRGDDNPDIWKYMGYGEYSAIYHTKNNHTLTLMTRYNFHSDAKGAAELTWSFPLNKRFRGYAQFFTGYGDSLIDYDESITRFSIGIALTDVI